MNACVARKTQVYSSKVKVTLRGQRSKIVYFSCPVHNFAISWRIKKLKLLCRIVFHHKMMCRVQDLDIYLQCQGQTLRSKVKHRVCYSITLSFLDGFKNCFPEMFTIIKRCVASKTQVYSSRVKIKLEVKCQNRSIFLVQLNFIFFYFLGGKLIVSGWGWSLDGGICGILTHF